MRFAFFAFLLLLALGPTSYAQPSELSVRETRFYLDDKPFPFTGISFFNALYNPTFNKNSTERKKWIAKFQRYGVNVFRVWAQWDNARGFVDACATCTLYNPDGSLRADYLANLKALASDAAELGVVIEFVCFSQESYREGIRLGTAEADRAVSSLTREMLPFRNVVFQIWNEYDERVPDHVKTIRAIDPKRLVTNSPGFSGVLGDPAENNALDYLTPHTSRQSVGEHWKVAPAEIGYLLTRYKKPVVDDEPARNGTSNFGGPKVPTSPYDQIVQIYEVWQRGGYIVYHHDMFQLGYGSPNIPPSGIPDPEFSPYHKAVLDFIAQREKYMIP